MRIQLRVNGGAATIDVEPATPLLYVLRNDLRLNGPRFGCGLGQCGACTVLAGGEPIRSCVTPVSAAGTREIVTLEGLGTLKHPHPIQEAFINEQAAQCGYCMSGVMLTAKAFLDKNPNPAGKVPLVTGPIDMGTAIETAFGQLIADELDVPFESVKLVMGVTELTPDQGKSTASSNVSLGAQPLRVAAAEARRTLLKMAADRFRVSVGELDVGCGIVRVLNVH